MIKMKGEKMKNNLRCVGILKKVLSIFVAISLLILPVGTIPRVYSATTSDTYVPLTVASGYNVDVIAEGSPASSYTSTSFDSPINSFNVFYSTSFYSVGGLPASGALTSRSSSPVQYQLAPYNQNNCIKLTSSSPTGTLSFTTIGSYSSISLLGASANGDGTFRVRLNYTDGTYTEATFTARDWFYNDGYVITSLGRVSRQTNTIEAETFDGGPRLYQYQVAANNTKLLSSITLTRLSGTSSDTATGILAISGIVASGTPDQVTAISASSVTNSSFTANWNAVSDVTGYYIDVATDSNFNNILSGYNNKNVGNVTSTSITGLSNGTDYYYRVRAYNSYGSSTSSNTIYQRTNYKLTYLANFANSGSVPIDSNSYPHGGSAVILGNTGNLQKSGYSFYGWNTLSSGYGDNYTAGNEIRMWSDTILYAKWVDDISPSISSVSVPSNGTYGIGNSLLFTVSFDEGVIVNTGGGVPYIPVTLNTGGSLNATYLSGSGTSNLTFRYTVQEGNIDPDGISLGSSIVLGGATIKDGPGNNANLTLNSVGSTSGVLVDGIRPTVSLSHNDSDGLVKQNDQVTISAVFSEVMTSSPLITITNGNVANQQMTNSGDGKTWTYLWTVPSGNATGLASVSGTDIAGNAYQGSESLSFTIDNAAPSGFSVDIDQSYISSLSDGLISFTFTGAEIGASYNYTITTSGGSGFSFGTGTITSSDQTVDNIYIGSLEDGTLTLSVILTDILANESPSQIDTITKDTLAPSGYSVSIDQLGINKAQQTGISFTIANGEAGSTYQYSISDSESPANTVSGSGTMATSSDQISGIDISSLSDGDITLYLTLTDVFGNEGNQVSDVKIKDSVNPTVLLTDNESDNIVKENDLVVITASFDDFMLDTPKITITNGGVSNANMTPSGDGKTFTYTWIVPIGNTNASVSVSGYDVFSNPYIGSDTLSFIIDNTAPTGHSAYIQQARIDGSNENFISFVIQDAETSSICNYSFITSGGSGSVTGSGQVTSSTQTFNNIDLSSLADGEITLVTTLTDIAGNQSIQKTFTVLKDTTPPLGYSISIDQDMINISNEASMSVTINNGEITSTYLLIIQDSKSNVINKIGTVTSQSHTVENIDISAFEDGQIEVFAYLTDTFGNEGSFVYDSVMKDATRPTLTLSDNEDDNIVKENDQVLITATFDEVMKDSPKITIENGNVENQEMTDSGDGKTWTYIWNVPNWNMEARVTVDGYDLYSNQYQGSDLLTFTIDNTAPSGHSVSFDQDVVYERNESNISFTFENAEINSVYEYTITSDQGSQTVQGQGNVSSLDMQIGNIDLSELADGTLTLSVYLTDIAGNTSLVVTDIVNKDTKKPELTLTDNEDDNIVKENDQVLITATFDEVMKDSPRITIENGNVEDIEMTDSGDGKTWTYTWNVPNWNIEAIVTVLGFDFSGNEYTGNESLLFTIDNIPPQGHFISIDQDVIYEENDENLSFTLSNAEVDTEYNYTIVSSGGLAIISSRGKVTQTNMNIDQIDVSSLSDGILTLEIYLTDPAGNVSQLISDTCLKDTQKPEGHSLRVDQDLIFEGNHTQMSFAMSGAEVTSTYVCTITSSGGDNSVIISGSVESEDMQVENIDISSLSDGNLTLSLVLTDTSGNVADPVEDTVLKDTKKPTVQLSDNEEDNIVKGNDIVTITATFDEEMKESPKITIENGDVENQQMTDSGDKLTWTYIWNVPNGNTTARVSISGFDSFGNQYEGTDKLEFEIDNGFPIVTGIMHTGTYEKSVTIYFSEGKATIDGYPFTNGSTYGVLGSHELIVTDSAGNKTIIEFEIVKENDGSENPDENYDQDTKKETFEFDKDKLDELIESGMDIEVKNDKASFVISPEDIKKDSLNDNINISIEDLNKDEKDTLNEKVNAMGYQMASDPVKITVISEGEDGSKQIQSFSGYVTGKISIPEGVDPEKITTGIRLNEDGSISHVPTRVLIENGKYYAQINSLVPGTFSVIWNPQTFDDIEGHWAKDDIEDMASRLVVDGIDNLKFNPEENVTRGAFTQAIISSLGLETIKEGRHIFTEEDKTNK